MAGGGRGLWHSGSGPVPPLHLQTGGDYGAGTSARLSRHRRGPDDPLRRARAPEQPPPPHQAAGPSCSALVFFLSPVCALSPQRRATLVDLLRLATAARWTVPGAERKKYLQSNDAQTLLEYLKNKQIEDTTIFYVIQIDEEDGWIANFFWANGQSIMNYACFGDAVSFDTTFQTNKFEMLFALILGTNHHKQTIIFWGRTNIS